MAVALRSRLTVQRDPPRASLGGQEFNLTDLKAAFLSILHENSGQWVGPKVFDKDPQFEGVRRDRLRKTFYQSRCRRSSSRIAVRATELPCLNRYSYATFRP